MLTDRDRRGGRWDADDFLATGEAEVSGMLERANDLGMLTEGARALDFGCGVGRLTRALSRRFSQAVGVDVSEEMVRRARQLNADRPNVEFAVNPGADLGRFPDASFDFALSLIVLQHMPGPETAERYVRELARVTRPGGSLVFQLPASMRLIYRLGVTRHAYRLARALRVPADVLLRRTPFTPMRMIFVPEMRVRTVLDAAGAEVRAVDPFEGDPRNLVYYVTRRSSS